MTPAQRERFREEYVRLVALPAEESRKLAVQQRDRALQGLRALRDVLGEWTGRWQVYDNLDADVAFHLKTGDDLATRTDETSRTERRRAYARAFQTAALAADEVDGEKRLGSTYRLALEDLLQGAADAATAIGQGAKKVLKKVDDTIDTLVWGLVIAGVVGAFAFGNSRGRRR